MALDGFVLRSIQGELSQTLLGGRIQKIYQPFDQEVQIVIRSKGYNYRLHLSIHPQNYRVHLTEDRPNNPQQAPMFAMVLRKHLEGGILQAIKQDGNDRILHFYITSRNELQDDKNFVLIIELMGRHSNLFLVEPETGTILECLKHVPAYQNKYRPIFPGAQYIVPPKNPEQKNIFTLTEEELTAFSHLHEEEFKEGLASKWIQGLGRQGARAIKRWLQEGQSVRQVLKHFMQQTKKPAANTYLEGNRYDYYYMLLPHIETAVTPYPSLSALLDAYYIEKARFDRIKQVSGNLIHSIEQIINRNDKKLHHLKQDRQIAQGADTYKLQGELLSAYMYQIKKGMTEVTVENYYDNNRPLTIELNPRLSPIENSQHYYKLYSKYRDSLKYIDQQEQTTREENTYLQSVLLHIEQAEIEDLEDIKEELMGQGFNVNKQKSSKKRVSQKSKPRRYRATDGTLIYVGRNNQQNDELSLKKAAKNHWWLHAKDIPGAHVIIESDRPSEATRIEAAEIAAYHSRSQHSANVPVDLVQVKALHKPNGARPGFVIYEGQTTLFVTPKEADIQKKQVD